MPAQRQGGFFDRARIRIQHGSLANGYPLKLWACTTTIVEFVKGKPEHAEHSAKARLPPRNFRKRVPDPVDHDARSGIALEMVLHQQPHVATARQESCLQPAVG